MKEYVCKLGHIHWAEVSPGARCPTVGCPAPAEWSGRRRGFLLDSHEWWAGVWELLDLDPENARGCWVWAGEVGHGGPRWRGAHVRREMWDWWWRGTWKYDERRWVCPGADRCVRPSHSAGKWHGRQVGVASRVATGARDSRGWWLPKADQEGGSSYTP